VRSYRDGETLDLPDSLLLSLEVVRDMRRFRHSLTTARAEKAVIRIIIGPRE
jgi:hypothetical protein